MSRTHTVKDVASIAGVTVRTLHHYDAIGLLSPRRRSEAGYRLYGDDDLRRLQQILLYRELGFPLETIGRVLDDPQANQASALRSQRGMLEEKVRRLKLMIAGVDEALASLQGRRIMNTEEAFQVLGDFDPSEYQEEVEERWGDTDSYRISAQRTSRYTKKDWEAIKGDAASILARAAALMNGGAAPSTEAAMDIAEAHRQHIDRWFYPIAPGMHAQLAEGYTADPRFEATFEKVAEGLAQWFADAVKANTKRQKSL